VSSNYSPQEFLGKRIALFGITRTDRSNSVKKRIQATVGMTEHAPHELDRPPRRTAPTRCRNLFPMTLCPSNLSDTTSSTSTASTQTPFRANPDPGVTPITAGTSS
jgi:hypothetical protein